MNKISKKDTEAKKDSLNFDLVTFVSHELKTPLSTLKLNTALLKDHIPAGQANIIKIMNEELDWMGRFIADTLDLQKTKERAGFNFGRRQWNKWMQNLQSDMEKQSALFGGKLKIRYAPQETEVYMDPLYIRQALFNLLTNALKYSHKNSVVEVSCQRSNKAGITVQVADEGPGISEKEKDKIFEFFYKSRSRSPATKPDGGGVPARKSHLPSKDLSKPLAKFPLVEIKSTGLGLPLVKRIIQAHGGRVHAENRTDGKGALFGFTLPAFSPNNTQSA